MLHALARGRTPARRGGDMPQLSRGDLQDVGLQEPGCGEDGVGAAIRVQILHVCVPAPLAATPRGEHVRREVTSSPPHLIYSQLISDLSRSYRCDNVLVA